MVYGTAFCPISMLEQVKSMGVAGMVKGMVKGHHHS
jgi:hypothetical protein